MSDDSSNKVISVDFAAARREREFDASARAQKGEVVEVAFGASAREPDPEPADDVPEIAVAMSDDDMRRAFDELIDEGLTTVTLDSRVDGVSVPSHLLGRPQLNLNFSRLFHIEDFDWDDVGVRASLSFGDGDFFCDVPWTAVYLLRCDKAGLAVLAPRRFPDELQRTLAQMGIDPDSLDDEFDESLDAEIEAEFAAELGDHDEDSSEDP
jgi:hypothetical protein